MCFFGASKSPKTFQTLTKAVSRIAKRFGYNNICVYLDDFLCIEKSKEECEKTQNFLLKLLRYLGYSISYNKLCAPTQKLTFLGIEISTLDYTLSIPFEKITKTIERLIHIVNQKTITKHKLQSTFLALQSTLSGNLFFVTTSHIVRTKQFRALLGEQGTLIWKPKN